MKVFVRSKFDCAPDLVWAEVQTSRLLEEVMYPLLRFLPADGKPFPARWPEGATYRGTLRVLGVIPLGGHSIFFERIDPSNRQIQTREKGPWIRLWDHLISVRDGAKGQTLYSDEIEIQAGAFTFFVWILANCFYRHRQMRWKRVVRRLRAAEAIGGMPQIA